MDFGNNSPKRHDGVGSESFNKLAEELAETSADLGVDFLTQIAERSIQNGLKFHPAELTMMTLINMSAEMMYASKEYGTPLRKPTTDRDDKVTSCRDQIEFLFQNLQARLNRVWQNINDGKGNIKLTLTISDE